VVKKITRDKKLIVLPFQIDCDHCVLLSRCLLSFFSKS